MEVGKEKRWLCGLQVVYATAVTKPGHGSMAPLAIGFTLFASAFVGAPSFMEKEVVGITRSRRGTEARPCLSYSARVARIFCLRAYNEHAWLSHNQYVSFT